MLGLGSIGYVQSFQYVIINTEPVRPSDYSQFVFLALCVFDFDIPALEEGAHEDEPELFFRGGKEEWQKFCETTLARDQKERDPV